MLKENRWSYNGDDLIIGNLKPLPKQFIPTDSTVIIPLNSVLKNNFYNGSYILEFFDQEKEELRDVLESEKLLDKICTCIRGFLPIDLLYIRDRIGNIIFQFPSRMLALDAKSLSTWEGIEAQIAWHPLFNDLDQISIQTSGHFDKNIMGFCQLDQINHHGTELYSGNSNHMNSTIVFNKENGLILSSFSASFMRHIHMTTDVSKPYQEPRTIKLFDEENNLVDTIEVPIVYRVGKQKTHDRFIIFPFKNGKPRAWSLGTSINSFGEKHHILQEVSNARMILDAFMELWEELQDPKCLVWRSK